MPRMMSIPGESRTIRLDKKSSLLMLTLIARHNYQVYISPPGELTNMVCFIVAIGRLCMATNLDDMND
jgi:hypothetical protein